VHSSFRAELAPSCGWHIEMAAKAASMRAAECPALSVPGRHYLQHIDGDIMADGVWSMVLGRHWCLMAGIRNGKANV